MEFVFGLENGHFQNASDQKSDTTSEDYGISGYEKSRLRTQN